jgi:BirA family biotin operon repressor/biotin-[acetyl-CoA-carboxylase] ligase
MDETDFPSVVGSGVVLRVLAEADSTNRFLAEHPGDPTTWSVVVTDHQTAGRGRQGRQWESPAGRGVALSIQPPRRVLPEPLHPEWLGWLALIVGCSLAEAIAPAVADRVSVKWPNDVQIAGKKVAGVLGEVTARQDVIIGVGLNLFYPADQLPTPDATSVTLHGDLAAEGVDHLLHRFLTTLMRRLPDIRNEVSGETRRWVESWVDTLDTVVRVLLPSGDTVEGVATGLGHDGSLIVTPPNQPTPVAISVGDIVHLRHRGD